MALGIGSFIGGAFQGFEFGENYKQKKKDNKRRDKLDTMAEEDRARRHRRENLDLAWTIEDRDRAKREREWLEGVYAEGGRRTDEAMAETPDPVVRTTTSESERRLSPPPAAPRGAAPEDVTPTVDPNAGRGVRPMARPEVAPTEDAPTPPSPVAARGVRPQPRPDQAADPEAELSARERGYAAANPGWMDEKLGRGHATREDDEDEDVGAAIADNAALARRTLENGNFPPEVAAELERIANSDMPRKSSVDTTDDARAARSTSRTGDLSTQRRPTPPMNTDNVSPVGRQAGNGAEPGWMEERFGRGHITNGRGARPPRPRAQPEPEAMTAAPAQPAAAPARGAAPTAPTMQAAPAAPGTAPTAPVAPAAPGAAPQAPQPPIADELVEQGTPSGETLAETVAEDTSRGATRPVQQVARDWVDEYARTGAPYVQEQLLRKGMLAEAKDFGEWIQTQETQAGMEAYASAALAAGRGDIEGFANSVFELYNNEGYYGDGLTIDTEASSFIRDDAGNIAGAEVTFRDAEGDPIVHTYESLDDLIEEAMTLLAPEKAFEHRLAQQKLADETRVDVAKKDLDREQDFQDFLRREVAKAKIGGGSSGGSGGKNDALKRAQDIADELAGSYASGWKDMSNEERIAAIAEQMAIEREAAAVSANPAAIAPTPIEPWRG